jgi:hypothetical protein
VTIDHSTLSGNRAPGGAGGGVFNQGTFLMNSFDQRDLAAGEAGWTSTRAHDPKYKT